jgi:hypothetical protein
MIFGIELVNIDYLLQGSSISHLGSIPKGIKVSNPNPPLISKSIRRIQLPGSAAAAWLFRAKGLKSYFAANHVVLVGHGRFFYFSGDAQEVADVGREAHVADGDKGCGR